MTIGTERIPDPDGRGRAARRTRLAVALAVLLVGGALRFVGVQWGLPFNLHVDEVQGSLHNPVRMEWNWYREGWPRPQLVSYGSLQGYVLLGLKDAVFGSERARSWAARASTQDAYVERAYRHDPRARDSYSWPALTLMMRVLSAVMYTLALALSGAVASRLWGERAAALTLVLGGGLPALVQHAHFCTGEGMITLGIMMLLHAALRISEGHRWRDYAYAAAALELMTNAKVTTAVFAAFLPLATWSYLRGTRRDPLSTSAVSLADSGRLWAALTAWVVGWFALNPAALRNLEWYFSPNTTASVTALARTFRRGGPMSDWALFYVDRPRTYFATQVMADACGRPFAAIAWVAFAWVLLTEMGRFRWPALFALGVFAPLWATSLHTVRYIVPALPLFALCVARLADVGVEALRQRPLTEPDRAWRSRASRGVWAAALAAISAGAAWAWFLSVGTSALHLRTDNRIAAARWLCTHARRTDRVVIGDHPMYRPPLVNAWGVGEAPDITPLSVDYLWYDGDTPNLQNARFVAVDGWELRMVDVPSFRAQHPGRARWLGGVHRRGAPEGYHLVARFDDRPGIFGWRRDESDTEISSFAFDHIPILVFERNAETPQG